MPRRPRRERREDRNIFGRFFEDFLREFEEAQNNRYRNVNDPPPAASRSAALTREENELYGEVIAAGFRALTKKYHPDNPETGNEEKMKRILHLREKIARLAGVKV